MIKPPDRTPEEGPVSEATLMRFIDGDLPPREHAFVAGLIAAHPQETKSVRAYRFTRHELPAAFEAALQVPPELISRCLADSAPTAMRALRPQRRSTRWNSATLPLAASIALLLAGASGWLLRDVTRSEVPGLLGVAPASLQYALDATLTGEVARLGGGVVLKPMSTFPSIDGRWCRHYVLLTDGDQNQTRGSGLACRTADGNWRIDVQSASRSLQRQTRGAVAPAAGEENPVTSYRDQIIGGNVLTKASEERLIKLEGWKREP